jgi:2-C-methyl-D-erythritol 4-phosphate cytidylyltransferase
MRVLAIIPSAGSGARFGSDVPKQYLDLGGRPVLSHAVECLVEHPDVAQVMLAVATDRVEPMRDSGDWQHPKIVIVAGGATRQQSVTRALSSAGADFDLVAVHDAVRPFIRPALLDDLFAAAQQYGASLPVLPVTDTIHVVEGGAIAETLDRGRLAAAQTPQCFRLDMLTDVLSRAASEGRDGTDEAGMAVHYGYAVRAIAGDPLNFKITHAQDLERARRVLDEWRKP